MTDDEMDEAILDMLADGYGVEDIAVHMQVPPARVRDLVFGIPADLRRSICLGISDD